MADAEKKDDLTAEDGRKVISFSPSGEAYSLESTEQAAKGKSAEIQAEIDAFKLASMKGGIRRTKFR